MVELTHAAFLRRHRPRRFVVQTAAGARLLFGRPRTLWCLDWFPNQS